MRKTNVQAVFGWCIKKWVEVFNLLVCVKPTVLNTPSQLLIRLLSPTKYLTYYPLINLLSTLSTRLTIETTILN